MSKPAYKTMKVFDCHGDPGMPGDVLKAFFNLHRDPSTGNDVYVEWTIERGSTDYYNEDEWNVKRRLVDAWLKEHGAIGRTEEQKYQGETVLIKHWW